MHVLNKSRPYFFLPGKCATQNLKKTCAILVYGHVDVLTYQGAGIKLMILA